MSRTNFWRAVRPILLIAEREVMRLRGRFGKSSPLQIVFLLIAAAGVVFMAFRSPPVIGENMYRVGVAPDGPVIEDRRFQVVTLDAASGAELLERGLLDAYVSAQTVQTRSGERGKYAADALRRVLEQTELARVRDTFPLAQGFPLRVELNYLDPPGASTTNSNALVQLVPTAAPRKATTTAAPAATRQPTVTSDAAVEKQLDRAQQDAITQINLQATADREIIVPSLLTPPVPFVQVILAFLYILPVTFVSVFFTGSFMDEKTNRRLVILFSAPITPLQIILGKMLPYVTFALAATTIIALVTGAPLGWVLAIFVPLILFVFAVYLMVPLLYRTFKDTTFISMLATFLLIGYLLFPAMFSGVNALAYMSPLTLAVKMYRGEAFGLREYLFATLPMMLIFALSLYVATRCLNEEFLMGYRSLWRKIAEALYLALDLRYPALSIFLLSLALVPVIYLFQLVALAVSLNLPLPIALVTTLFAAAFVQEAAKSIGIRMLIEQRRVTRFRRVLLLAGLSALGFVAAQSLLLAISLGMLTPSALTRVLFGAVFSIGSLVVNFVTTALVCGLYFRFKVRYRVALLAGTLLQLLFNLWLAGGLL